jgi:hypothetical protein
MKTETERALLSQVDAFLAETVACRKDANTFTHAELYHAARIGYRMAEEDAGRMAAVLAGKRGDA